MEIGRPLRVVTPTVDGDVLKVLALAPTADFTAPTVHRLIGARSVEGVRKSLARLSEQGIVTTHIAGRARLYRFNEQHLAAPAVIALADLRATLLVKLTTSIEQWREPCAYAALFGSAARGTMRADSDLDVFVVRPDNIDPEDLIWTEQISGFAREATSWTGNDTRVLEYSEADVREGLRIDEAVLADIVSDGVRLAGSARYLTASTKKHKE